MAYVPDAAIDNFSELSKGARLLYVFLCRVRNQETGRCFPSVPTTMAALGVNKPTVYALRKEIASKNWATFDGDKVTQLFGFSESLKNQTVRTENKVVSISRAAKSEKSDFQSEKSDFQSEKSDFQSEKSDFQSEKSDSHIRNNQQIEPANRTKERESSKQEALKIKFSPLSLALCEICKLNPDLLSPIRHSDLIAAEKKLSANQRSPDEVREFGRRWLANDWRGLKGDAPSLTLVLDEWERVMSANGPVNHLGETWEQEKARRIREEKQREGVAANGRNGWKF